MAFGRYWLVSGGSCACNLRGGGTITIGQSKAFLVLSTALLLAPFVAILVWERRRYRAAPMRFLVRLGPQSRWQTRPTLLRTQDDLASARAIAESIESAGLGHVKVCTFLRSPTMDLLVEPSSPEVSNTAVQEVVGRRGQVKIVREGFLPLRYH